ncbi:URC4/urg3 family protein [Leptolyngbya sp. AN03gr2]|uniref:URC4/urg3 family protein n=1 Tax=unclassified Leptolyngbya TaxID=2650499 RepID=UPI003D323C63
MTNLVEYLRSPSSIRDRCYQLFELAQADQLTYFRLDLSQLDPVADYVIAVIREHYPDLDVPFHSRWRHFEVGNIPRVQQLEGKFSTPIDQAKAMFDLVIPSVLLDAGAGDRWNYLEASTGQTWARSEGLAIASFDAFCSGAFSDQPYQTDAEGLKQITPEKIAKIFQVTSDNPLVGLEGRSNLLQKLGYTIEQSPDLFGTIPRPGNLVDYLVRCSDQGKLSAVIVLDAVLKGLGEIWSGRLSIDGINLGDVWKHSALPDDQLVPFHKLSQWLTYSLLEPLQTLGLTITNLDQMTGLPEYRNGGLCLDLGLLQLKNPQLAEISHSPDSELIVEWRALTVCLLDRIADTIRLKLDLTPDSLPLVKVLQGGTWTAGRKIAASLRPNGTPPIQISSDGTVF